MSRAADRARQIAQGNAHRYMFDRFDDGGEVDQPEQQPDVPVGGAVGQTLHRVADWWRQQPSWLEQAKAIHEQSDPKTLRPSEAAIDFASSLPGPATLKGVGAKLANAEGLKLFQNVTGRAFGSAPTDLDLLGKGDMMLPPGVTPKNFHEHVGRMVNDVKQWNTPQRRYWYENSGKGILDAVGGDHELADRLTAGISKTSQGTGVLQNAAYAARGHHQAMLGEPVHTGMYPNVMGKHVQGYYTEPDVGVVGHKITGYQSGFRSAWEPVLNRGANDRHNMRWLGWEDFGLGKGREDATPTTAQHNYDRMVRSAVTHQLNAEGYDGGKWLPGQVQAVGWAKARAASGVPAEEAGYDLVQAFKDRAAQLTYETAPGKTLNHMPEYHAAPWEQKVAYHDAINRVLEDEQGRDLITSHMGLLTHPTKPGMGVYQGAVSPGSQAQVITGIGVGGAKSGIDKATRELLDASELTRGLLLRQDAVAGHLPQFIKGLPQKDSNLIQVNTGAGMTEAEAQRIMTALAKETGSSNFSPLYTDNGWRVLNYPNSGLDNKQLQGAVDRTVRNLYADREHVDIQHGFSDPLYHEDNWSKTNGQGYLAAIRGLRPDLQRRVSEVLAALGPKVSRVEEDFAKRYGWTPDRASRVWERNPAYQAHQAEFANVPVGKPPRPWEQQTRPFYPELLRARGGGVAKDIAKRTALEHEVDGRLRDLRVRSIVQRKPRIIHDSDIPYVAGCSNDLEKLYVDRDFPLEEILDLEALWLHESGEALFMRLFHDEYDTAHRLITVAEKRLVLKHGHKWEAYNAPFQRYAKHAEHERIRRVPKDLFMAPYLESGDNALVRHMRACMR